MKYALAACNGMSPNGLVCRVAVGDCRRECENAISICMGSTAADIEGVNNDMLLKYPIVAVNGCVNNCVNVILKNKGIDVSSTVNAADVLEDYDVTARDAFRLDSEAEECVRIIKKEIESIISQNPE